MEVELPAWDVRQGTYALRNSAKKVAPKKGLKAPGVTVDFHPDKAGPLLVDFTGGKNSMSVGATTVSDQSAYELLIVHGDGKLQVRSSWEDQDSTTALGQQRRDRYEAWREQLRRLRQPAPQAGPSLPGLK